MSSRRDTHVSVQTPHRLIACVTFLDDLLDEVAFKFLRGCSTQIGHELLHKNEQRDAKRSLIDGERVNELSGGPGFTGAAFARMRT